MKCIKSYCNEQFTSLEKLRLHLKHIHNMKTNDDYECSELNCGKNFNRSDKFYDHIKKNHTLSIESTSVALVHKTHEVDELIDDDNFSSQTQEFDIYSTTRTYEEDNTLNTPRDDIIEKIFFNFSFALHSEPTLSKKLISKIMNMTKTDIIEPLLELTGDKTIINEVNNSFKKIGSFYKFKKNLVDNGLPESSNQKTISQKTDITFKEGRPVYDTVKESIYIMPVQQQVKRFFELPNVLTTVVENMKHLENNEQHISNFVQCEIWKKIKSNYNDNDIVIPCFLYHDDFEPDNPLGSNAGRNKIAAFYYTFPVIPSHLLSSPEYVFEALMCQSALKDSNLDMILNPLVEIFSELETCGIRLSIKGVETRIFVVLCLIIGDNLALNELLGFNKSFNSTFFCRYCTTPKIKTMQDIEIRKDNLRSMVNYEHNLKERAFGVKNNCVFNELKYFHVTSNFSCDIMHDIFEGIARYDVALILNYIVNDQKIIDLCTLNKFKQEFDYGSIEIKNMGAEIKESQLKNGNLIMSASEMKTFIHFLPLMIGHKMQDKKHTKVWKLLCELIELIDLVMQSVLNSSEKKNLQDKITSYLKNRLQIFPNQNLKPKHHLLLHYPNCIEKSGPLRYLMSFVYEQKNRIVKTYSKICYQRINLPSSLTYKSIMRFNHFLDLNKNGFPSLYQDEKVIETINWADIISKEYYNSNLFNNSWRNYPISSLSAIRYKSTLFKIGFFVALKSRNTECFKIIDILKKEEQVFIVIEKYKILEYSKHNLCYYVGDSVKYFTLVELKDFNYFPFNLHQTVDGKIGFRLKHV